MKNSPSILHTDNTLAEDYKLILYILEKSYGKKPASELTDKIISNIQSKNWQQKFPSTHFVFIVDEQCRQDIGDIKFLWMCQVLDIIYFYEIFKPSGKSAEELHNPGKHGFDKKVKKLFQYYYKKSIENSEAIKIARNNVVHTGNIDGMSGAIKQNDLSKIADFKVKYKVDSLRSMAMSANLLFFDMFVRSMGLNDANLSFSGLQPQNLNFFIKS
ncbi:MAG: hypothetical protein COV70_03360 [Parcubacteria group bacterium CG11_big_fil_rev_8_21_14_0_20_39_22]|nr:MAG: hypothetical protein COV70_03360 [Parcubacteria group bacterium CG11_big_fil_rev_8_21_14_0_20_39_22]